MQVPITPKAAAESAARYFKDLFGEPFGLALEEAEPSKDGRYWLITLGYHPTIFTSRRNYKLFTVDAETGKVVSMKIRRLE
jgi:hypothetical protein